MRIVMVVALLALMAFEPSVSAKKHHKHHHHHHNRHHEVDEIIDTHDVFANSLEQNDHTVSDALCVKFENTNDKLIECFQQTDQMNVQLTIDGVNSDPILGCPVLLPSGYHLVIDPETLPEWNETLPVLQIVTGTSCKKLKSSSFFLPVRRMYTEPLENDFNVLIFRPTSKYTTLQFTMQYIPTTHVMSGFKKVQVTNVI